MKRNLSLVRSIMLRIEERPAGADLDIDALADLHHDRDELVEHVTLMEEAGLLSVIDTSDMQSRDYIIQRMTWDGHEFLDATRDEGVWKKVREKVIGEGSSWTFEIVKEWAKHELKQRLGLPK